MKRSNRAYLQDMLVYIERIEQTTQASKANFESSFIIQDAVIRQYEVIGEIAKRIHPDLLATQTTVDWRSIKGIRDFLIHNYDQIDVGVLWSAVEKISILRHAVESILSSLPPEE